MDEKELMLNVLKAIRIYCMKNVDCTGCPFSIGNNSWNEYCMFAGSHFDEGVNPEEWKIEEVIKKEGEQNGR